MFDSTDKTYLEVNREGGTDIKKNYRKDKMSFWNELRPMVLSRIEDIVVDVKEDPVKYDAYINLPDSNNEDDDNNINDNDNEMSNSGNKNISKEKDDKGDMDKYFLATWFLAGVSIILAICIVVLVCITYRAKTDACTFEGTKL